MAHPRSHHMPSSADLAGGLGAIRPAQDVLCTPHPPHIHDTLSPTSPKSSVTTSPFVAIKQETDAPTNQHLATEAMILEEPMSMQWTDQPNLSLNHASQSLSNTHTPNPFAVSSEDFVPYTQNGMSYNTNYNVMYGSQFPSLSCPRSYHGLDITGLPSDVSTSAAYPPAVYQIEPPKHYDTLSEPRMDDHLMQMRDDYEHHYGIHIQQGDHGGYDSPYSDMTRASTPSGHEPVVDKDQPYAQLIYQALRQAKGHTMILRDIYEWFMVYTDKAISSETKGWQNSIRHNLSMNGAFEKVDHPCEDSRKGFMWRLTEEALREGVKSTTRYRSKQPNKRGNRAQHPQPQRQASGAKGGQAARRSANIKRSKRAQDQFRNQQPYSARSVPSEFHLSYNNTDISMPYTSSPYYGSDVEYACRPKQNEHHSDFNNPQASSGNPMDLFSRAQSFPEAMAIGDTAYTLAAQSPSEPLFTTSPTPSADEPRTPMSQGGWVDEMILGAPCSYDDMAMGYQAYAG